MPGGGLSTTSKFLLAVGALNAVVLTGFMLSRHWDDSFLHFHMAHHDGHAVAGHAASDIPPSGCQHIETTDSLVYLCTKGAGKAAGQQGAVALAAPAPSTALALPDKRGVGSVRPGDYVLSNKVVLRVPAFTDNGGVWDYDAKVEELTNRMLKEWEAGGKQKPGPGYEFYDSTFPKWPYKRIKPLFRADDIGIFKLMAPMTDTYYEGEMDRAHFWRLKENGHIILGCASYMHFPGEIHNPLDQRHVHKDHDMIAAMDGWMHPFRDPSKYIPDGIPRILMSESDFYDCDRDDSGGRLIPKGLPKQWDFMHLNNGGSWNDYNRNWTLAKDLMVHLLEKGHTVLLCGRDISNTPELNKYLGKGLTHKKFTPWRDFLDLMEQSGAMLMPNVHDGSPRVVTEAFCRGTPVMMNWHIAGGWKYVNNQTGVFFHDASDFDEALGNLKKLQDAGTLRPRQWYMENYGFRKAGVRLQAFLELIAGKERLAKVRRIKDDAEANSYSNKVKRGEKPDLTPTQAAVAPPPPRAPSGQRVRKPSAPLRPAPPLPMQALLRSQGLGLQGPGARADFQGVEGQLPQGVPGRVRAAGGLPSLPAAQSHTQDRLTLQHVPLNLMAHHRLGMGGAIEHPAHRLHRHHAAGP